MDIILVAGLWLRRSVWSGVASELERLGHRPIPVALPGADDGDTSATLADQVDAVMAAVEAAEQPVVVGHSAACTLVWTAADRRPESIRRLVLIGGFPAAHGETYAAFFDTVDGVMAFPGWEPFEGPDSVDLDSAARESFAAGTVPVPGGVANGTVELSDDRRYEVPTVAVCPEYTADQLRGWIEAGDVPELRKVKRLTLVDIESGHWPMITRPAELARILADAAVAH